ncbi:truncated hemoglobin GlbN [Seminavis robusta]|uniref:Truncated hemoglobin GlbN n=1 Tax=Seminavis robusta TaxID=568900 RepID=A0A9N8DD68_9STRA|nr:truncated hemoglobin GlbN [Seminavis robusta]|eukprot:Sro41_g025280.1 truncated hemoglobin GlbN (210) ;mRNA; r:106345-106974
MVAHVLKFVKRHSSLLLNVRQSLRLSSRELDNSNQKIDNHPTQYDTMPRRNHQCPQQHTMLLDRLGGMLALQSIMQDFSSRVATDASLAHFFQGVDFRVLSRHHKMFFAMAFTEAPDSATLEDVMRRRHQHLFAQGLNEHHFDVVAGHLIDSLAARGFQEDIMEEVAAIMSPMRQTFIDLAREAAMLQDGSEDESCVEQIRTEQQPTRE